ncbi:Holliday junction branch migration DNA helicase RuvB [bacterium]|nr:Holliday junction branch migration DNA helicase RuvB [bacterium]
MEFKNHSIVSREESKEDLRLDQTLRPRSLKEFIGQNNVKENLKIFIKAAKQRKEAIEHVLLHGGPGLGKTTLANIIAHEMGVNIKVTSGPALERAGDLAAILTSLENGDILFIDEIHRLNRSIEEILYPAMEDFGIDLILGKGPSAKTMRLDLPIFTLIGATTKPNLISSPLRDRFGIVFQLNFYKLPDIENIIKRSAEILGIKITKKAVKIIAKSSRFTPRIANRLLKRVRDFAQVRGEDVINGIIAQKALDLLGIDELGLNEMDRKILRAIIEKFRGGPVGLKSIALAVGENVETIEEIFEPYLIQIGFLNRTSRGRVATDFAYKHLKIKRGLI